MAISLYIHYDSFQIIAAALLLLTIGSLTKRIYNAFFHPCAGFPGPWSRAVSHWEYYWEQLAGKSPDNIHKLHQRYGPVVRIAPDRLSFITSAALKDIYGFRHDRRQIPKDYKRFPIGAGDYLPLFASDDATHARLRRLVAHAFSETALREQEALIQSHIGDFVQQLRKISYGEDPVVDMDEWLDWLSFDILSDLTWGESFGCVKNSRTHEFIQDCYSGCNMTLVLQMAWDYSPVHWLISVLFNLPSIKLAMKGSAVVNKKRVQKRIDMGADARKDFMTYILRHNDSDGKPAASLAEMHGLALVFMAAGGEEPSSLLSGIVYHLMRNPEVLRMAREEVKKLFASSDEITFASVKHLVYVDAVIQETCRIRPPASGHFSRRTTSDTIIDGHLIPANTSVVVSNYAAGRAASNFADPDEFKPERWLAETPAAYLSDDRAALQPFGLGPRGCVGKNLAHIIVRCTVAVLLLNFDLKLAEPEKKWDMHPFRTVWHRPGMKIILSPRE